ncbi:MAG: serine hydrolase domain-containing protein [Hyphomicrobiales bacterium]
MQPSITPAPSQPTLANWRTAPFNRWAFRHVREIVPSARIARGPLTAWRLERDIRPLEALAFQAPDGRSLSIAEMAAETFTDGLIVLKHGRILHESYHAGHDAETPHIVFSVSKSVTALLAGVLVGQGRLDPDAPVTHYVPEAKASAYRAATVRHVLDMTVGVAFEENYLAPDPTFLRYREATNWNPPTGEPCDLNSFLSTLPPDGSPHGEAFHYVSPNSDMLGWIIERAGGRRYADLATDLLWRPMRPEADAYVTVDRLGAARAAGGVCMTLRDIARIGEMVRCRGMAGGRQVVPGEWIDDIAANGDPEAWAKGSMKGLIPGGRYRSKWYVTKGGVLMAIGIHGQWIYVDRAAGIVIAKQSSQPEPADDPADALTVRAFKALAREA